MYRTIGFVGVSWLYRVVFLLVLVSVPAGVVLCVSLLTLLRFTSLIDVNFVNQQH